MNDSTRTVQNVSFYLTGSAQAYEQRSLIVTSNRPYQEWGSIFASTPIATAILDRLLHHVTTLSLRGDSYRLKGGMPPLPPAELPPAPS